MRFIDFTSLSSHVCIKFWAIEDFASTRISRRQAFLTLDHFAELTFAMRDYFENFHDVLCGALFPPDD
jgi:hypothetical protein